MRNIFITSDGYVYKDITQQAKKMTCIEVEMYEVWTDKHGNECHALIETRDDLIIALTSEHVIAIEIGTVGELFEDPNFQKHIPATQLKPQIVKAYLDYVNNYLTVQGFAEAYGLDYSSALALISTGAKVNNNLK